MLDLKPFYDAVNDAEAEVQRIAGVIDAHFREGTEEGKLAALALRSTLDEAMGKKDEAVALYESMQKTNRPNDIVKNFVPVSPSEPDPDVAEQPTVVKRAAYDALSLTDRAKFIRSGGTVED